MKPVANHWLTAAKSGYAAPRDWMSWADKIIEGTEHPSAWIGDVSIADSTQKLEAALQERLEREATIVDPEHHNALLGYLFIRYREGKISFSELLQEAGENSDSGPVTVECERFYALLNRLENAQTDTERQVIAKAAEELFKPFFQMAQSQWDSLKDIQAESKL